MKTVMNNSMVAHTWAHQSQEHARSGSMSFNGPHAYSYRAHVASIVRTAAGGPGALITSERYSVTTARHLREYMRAASHLPCYRVPDVTGTAAGHALNLAHLEGLYTDARAVLMRCPADSWRLADERPMDRLRDRACKCADYANVFNVSRDASKIFDVAGDVAAIIARRDRLLNDPKRAEKLAKAAAARECAEAAKREKAKVARLVRLQECAALITRWRAGEPVQLPYDARTNATGSAMLRVRGDIVQTSRGAEVPLDHVQRTLRYWRLTVDANALPWQRTDSAHGDAETRLGAFQLDSIDAAGNVRAGCHYIERAEVEALERVLA